MSENKWSRALELMRERAAARPLGGELAAALSMTPKNFQIMLHRHGWAQREFHQCPKCGIRRIVYVTPYAGKPRTVMAHCGRDCGRQVRWVNAEPIVARMARTHRLAPDIAIQLGMRLDSFNRMLLRHGWVGTETLWCGRCGREYESWIPPRAGERSRRRYDCANMHASTELTCRRRAWEKRHPGESWVAPTPVAPVLNVQRVTFEPVPLRSTQALQMAAEFLTEAKRLHGRARRTIEADDSAMAYSE